MLSFKEQSERRKSNLVLINTQNIVSTIFKSSLILIVSIKSRKVVVLLHKILSENFMFSKWVKYCLEVTITATFHKTGLSFLSVSMYPPSPNHRIFIQSLLSFEILYLRHANVTEYSLICLRNSLSQCQRAKELRNRSGICCIPRLSNGIPQKHKCPRQAACVPM